MWRHHVDPQEKPIGHLVEYFPCVCETLGRRESQVEIVGQPGRRIPYRLKIVVLVGAVADPRMLVQRAGRFPQVLQPTLLKDWLRQEIVAAS